MLFENNNANVQFCKNLIFLNVIVKHTIHFAWKVKNDVNRTDIYVILE